MTLEFFEDGGERAPLLLLYGGSREEVGHLRTVFRSLAQGLGQRVALHDLPFVRSVDSCALVAISSKIEAGVMATRTPGAFEWILPPSGWDNVEGLLEAFCGAGESSAGFQHLNPWPGAEVIYSMGRSW